MYKAINFKKTDIENNPLGLFYINGIDEYLVKRIKNIFISLSDNGYDVIKIDSDDTFNKLKKDIETFSLFSTKKVIIVDDINSSQYLGGDELLEDTIFKKPKEVIILFTNSRISLFKKLFKKMESIDATPLNMVKQTTYINNYLSEQNIKIDSDALNLLLEKTGVNLDRAISELDKMILYIYPSRTIVYYDIQECVSSAIEYTIFNIIDALVKKQHEKVIQILIDTARKGISEAEIMSLLIIYYQRMFEIKISKKSVAEIAEIMQKKTYHISSLKTASRNYGAYQLKKIVDQLLSYEQKYRTSKLSVQSAFKQVIVLLLSS